eukprot:1093482-Rhodomonas_salina.1
MSVRDIQQNVLCQYRTSRSGSIGREGDAVPRNQRRTLLVQYSLHRNRIDSHLVLAVVELEHHRAVCCSGQVFQAELERAKRERRVADGGEEGRGEEGGWAVKEERVHLTGVLLLEHRSLLLRWHHETLGQDRTAWSGSMERSDAEPCFFRCASSFSNSSCIWRATASSSWELHTLHQCQTLQSREVAVDLEVGVDGVQLQPPPVYHLVDGVKRLHEVAARDLRTPAAGNSATGASADTNHSQCQKRSSLSQPERQEQFQLQKMKSMLSPRSCTKEIATESLKQQ